MRNPVIQEELAELLTRNLPWDRFRNKRILVSGAYGFINAYLVDALLYLNEKQPSEGFQVIALGRSKDKARRRFGDDLDRPDFQFLCQDVCDAVSIDGPIDFVLHGASWASPRFYGKDPVGVLMPNIFGTRNMLELAREKQAEGFLFFSSAETYGDPPPEEVPIKETFLGNVDPVAVRSCYAESKRMGETMSIAWSHNYGIPVKIARIFHTYGPGMALDDGRVFADFVADVVHGRDIEMNSDGSARRAFCYLPDAADGLFRILLQGESGLPYNMGNEDAEVSVRELAEIMVGLFPEKGLKTVFREKHQDGYLQTTISRTVPDTSRLRALGWKPIYRPEEGFRRTVLSYEDSAS